MSETIETGRQSAVPDASRTLSSHALSRRWEGAQATYDAAAASYDRSYDVPGHRRAYDILAGERIAALLGDEPAHIVDAGCGTGRWARRWLAKGHVVTGIERAPSMVAELRRIDNPRFTLVEASMDEAVLTPRSADLVVAMGSPQYTSDPAATVSRFAGWVKPGGAVCIYVDSLLALVLELIRLGRTEEAIERLDTRIGRFRLGEHEAPLHLFSADTLRALMSAAGLVDVQVRGLVISASAQGRGHCAAEMARDEEAFLEIERRLSAGEDTADAGIHLIAWGRRPAG